MQRLDLNKCEISIDRFVPNVIMDKSLYDDIFLQTGVITCRLMCGNNETEIQKVLTKFVMMLEAYNDGYIKALRGHDKGLKSVYGVVGTPKHTYCGNKTLEVKVDIVSMMYNPYMPMAVVEDCLRAGATSRLMPDFKRYFDVKMDDSPVLKVGTDKLVKILEPQKELFKTVIMDNVQVIKPSLMIDAEHR